MIFFILLIICETRSQSGYQIYDKLGLLIKESTSDITMVSTIHI